LFLGFFVLLLGLVIGAHEAGHLAAALACRVRVEEVGLGLPPRLLWLGRLGSTRVSLNLLLLGGFIRPAGEFDPAVSGGLAASAPWRRVSVFVAGPAANLLLALVLLTMGFATQWPDRVRVVAVSTGSPAAEAGMQPGDLIITLGGDHVTSTEDLRAALQRQAGQTVTLTLDRGGNEVTLAIALRSDPPPGQGPAGFDTQGELVSYPLPLAVRRAGETIATMAGVTAKTIADLLRGSPDAVSVQLVGPLGLKQYSDRALANAVDWGLAYPVLYLGAWLATAVGLVNLLPLPALDGGRIALALVEVVTRRRMPPHLERRLHAGGMVVLLLLLLVLTVRDVAARLM
jgi:regulator of sigma E protease